MKFTTAIPRLAALALGARLLACTSGDSGSASALGAAGAAGSSAVGGGAGRGGAGSGGAGSGGAGSGGAGSGGAGSGGVASGGCSGTGTGTVPAPLCPAGKAGATITYSTLNACGQPVAHTHECSAGCVFSSPTSVSCVATGGPPFRTCVASTDCGSATYCINNSTAKRLDSPVCNDGVCDWTTSEVEACAAGAGCSEPNGSCQFFGGGGSTSGSFPSSMKGTCDGDNLVYVYFSQSGGAGGKQVSASISCKAGCVEDAAGAGCLPAIDEPPRHTCSNGIPCEPSPSRCTSNFPTQKITWHSPSCPLGLCEWLYSTTSPCPSGTTCTDKPCGE